MNHLIRQDFRKKSQFFQQSQRIRSRHFFAYISPSTNKLEWTVVVPKKQLSLSSQRNRLKRRVRAVVQSWLETNSASGKIMFVLSRSISTLAPDKLKQEVIGVLRQVPHHPI